MKLISDLTEIGARLHSIRKKAGFSQAELAEQAGISTRTYADIERGTANARLITLVNICNALRISADDVLVAVSSPTENSFSELMEQFSGISPSEQDTAARLLAVYLHSVRRP